MLIVLTVSRVFYSVACLKRCYGTGNDLLALARAKSYRVHVTKIDGNGGGGFAGGRTISYWCFAPALAMRELSFLKVRSILITSGTLSPLPSFSLELGLDFPVQLENDHVIQSDQIFVRVLGKGVSGKELSSKFGRRDDPEYILELGNTLGSLCRNIPGGVLVFFPSYSAMYNCIEKWGGPTQNNKQSGDGKGGKFFAAKKRQATTPRYAFPQTPSHFMTTSETSTPWKRLLTRKAIVIEPRSTSDLSDAIAEFKRFIALPKSPGCFLFGICRGKVSEGIDFSDDMCRAVVVTGLPFAPYLDPKVKLKREFLDAARASEKARPSDDGGFGNAKQSTETNTGPAQRVPSTLSGAEWYNQQAHRAVNQAIGRVIRHRNDYGAVLLLDHRFAQQSNRDGLSKWIRPYLRDETVGTATRGLVQFYKESKQKAGERIKIEYEKNKSTDNQERDTSGEVTKVAYVRAKNGGGAEEDDNGFIANDRVEKVFGTAEESPIKDDFAFKVGAGLSPAPLLGNATNPSPKDLSAAYRKKSQPIRASNTPAKSAFANLGSKPKETDTSRLPAKKVVTARRDAAASTDTKSLAKQFFEKGK